MKKSVKLTSMASMAALATLSMSTLTFANSPQNPADLNTATPVNTSIVTDPTTSEELVPVRSIGEAYGFDVDWYNNTKMTVLSKDGHEYATEIDSPYYEINHDIVSLSTPSQLINGVTYVPVSFAYAIEEDMGNTSEITDNGNGGNGGGYGGGDTTDNGGDETEDGFDFDNPNIDNGFTIDENAGFDFENPDIDNGFTIDENAGFDFENPDIDNGFTIDENAGFDYENPDIDNGYNVDVQE